MNAVPRFIAIALLAGVSIASTAVALPGDPPVAPLSPADGATVPTDPGGIPITYACPIYGRYVDFLTGIAVLGYAKDYTATVAGDPSTRADGKLARPIRTSSVVPIGAEPGTCSTTLGGPNDFEDARPHRAPGVYFWQVSRSCSDCASGDEIGPVWRVTVRLGTKLILRAPKVAFVGFPALVTVKITGGIAAAEAIKVERQVGTKWQEVAATSRVGDIAAEETSARVRLPRGTHRLRASVTQGTDTVTSQEVVMTVRTPSRRAAAGPAKGNYRDPKRPSLRFSVTDADVLKDFHSSVTLTCPSIGGVPDIRPGLIDLPPVPIGPDGQFVTRTSPTESISAWLQGRRNGKLVTGYASLRVGSCSGDLRFTARRV